MEWTKIQLLVGTVDYTSYLADKEQTANLPDGSEIGRASFILLDQGSMPAISDWSAITLKGGGTAATVNLWAGYVTRQQSDPFNYIGGSARYVTLDCQSAAIKLLTTAPVTEQYGGGNNEAITTDRDVVDDLVSTYAPSLYNVAKIGTADQVDIDYIAFDKESLRSALNKLGQRVGRTFGVDAVPEFWYRSGGEAGYTSAYDYWLTDIESEYEGGRNYLPMSVKPLYDRDATQLRNSVRVLGGQTLSTVQEETFPGDDVTTVFQVDYPPDVVVEVTNGGIAQTVGVYFVDDPADFDCLVEYDRRQFHFNVAPETGKNVVIRYRYRTRVDVTYQDSTSIAAVGTIWAPVLEDGSISSAAQGSALGSAYLASTQAVTRATVSTRHGGTAGTVLPYEPGRLLKVTTEAFGWTEQELRIKGVTLRAQPRPGGDGSCIIIWDLDLGSSPLTAGYTFGNQWNNTEVLSQQYPADRSEAQTAALIESGTSGLDHGGLTGLSDDDHPQYLLATGARTGASNQAQTFTNGIIAGGTANYAQFDSTGHLTFGGTGKPWNDVLIEPNARTTGTNAPAFEKWYDDTAGTSRGVYLYSFDDANAGSEKEVFFTLQMPHSWDGGAIQFHVHWVGAVADTTATPRWGLEYTWKEPGGVFGDTTIVYATGNHLSEADITANKHYITAFTAITPGSTADDLSSVLIGRLFRNSSDVADTYNATGAKCGLLYIDAHFQLARLGSTDEYSA